VLNTKQNHTWVSIDMKADKNVVQFVEFLFFMMIPDVPAADADCEEILVEAKHEINYRLAEKWLGINLGFILHI